MDQPHGSDGGGEAYGAKDPVGSGLGHLVFIEVRYADDTDVGGAGEVGERIKVLSDFGVFIFVFAFHVGRDWVDYDEFSVWDGLDGFHQNIDVFGEVVEIARFVFFDYCVYGADFAQVGSSGFETDTYGVG